MTLKETRANFYNFLYQKFGEEATQNKTRKEIKTLLMKIVEASLEEKNKRIKELEKKLENNKKKISHKVKKNIDPRTTIRVTRYFK